MLARLFSPEVVGQYALVNTVVNLALIFTVFGLDNGLVKYISRYKSTNQINKLKQVIKIAFIYGGLLSFIGAVVIFYSRELLANNVFKDYTLGDSLIYGAWLIIPLTLIRLFSGLYRGFKKLKHYVISKSIMKNSIFIILITLFFMLDFRNTPIVILSLLLSQLVVLFYLVLKSEKLGISFKKILLNSEERSKSVKWEILKYSSTLIFISFTLVILNKIDRIMLGIYMGSDKVGIYSIAAKIAELIVFLLGSSNIVFSSVISELYSTNKLELLENLYSTVTKWIIIITLPVVVSMISFSRVVVSFFGQEYIVGSTVLTILALGQMINAFVGANGYILNMSGHEKIALTNNSIMAIINIVMNIIFIPKFGINGAALATGLSISIINIVKIFEVKFILDINPYKREYLHLFINLCVVVMISLLFKNLYNNIVIMVLVTIINVFLSIFISYQFKNQFDEIIFKKVETKIKGYF